MNANPLYSYTVMYALSKIIYLDIILLLLQNNCKLVVRSLYRKLVTSYCIQYFYRVIALDLKGFGDSDKPLSRRFYKLEILLEELTIFISSLGASRCAVVGHDLGAMLGWYLIHLNPDLISKFVAISCAHPNVHWRNIPKNSIFNYK